MVLNGNLFREKYTLSIYRSFFSSIFSTHTSSSSSLYSSLHHPYLFILNQGFPFSLFSLFLFSSSSSSSSRNHHLRKTWYSIWLLTFLPFKLELYYHRYHHHVYLFNSYITHEQNGIIFCTIYLNIQVPLLLS